MQKIYSINDSFPLVQELHRYNQKIVLVGGCFDILHEGHIQFLNAAKKYADILIVLLESDESIRKRKGSDKPKNLQDDRARILAAVSVVDYIIELPFLKAHAEYDAVVLQLKPAIIATTKGDPGRSHKERQAEKIKATVIDVIDRLPSYASSSLAEKI